MFRRAKALVGLDIGSSAVKAVELKPAGKGYKVTGFGSEPVPPTASSTARLSTARRSRDSIRRLFESREIEDQGSGGVAVGQCGHRQEDHPADDDRVRSSSESIYWEAEQYIPFDIQDVNLDYQILDDGDAAGGTYGACCWWRRRRKKSRDYTGVIGQAGRTAVVVDVDVFALQNAGTK